MKYSVNNVLANLLRSFASNRQNRSRETQWLIMKGETVQRGEAIPVASGESEVHHKTKVLLPLAEICTR